MIPQKNPLIASGESVHANMLTKLWENPDSSADFAAQNIDLSSDDYDFLLILFKYYKSVGKVFSCIVQKGISTNFGLPISANASNFANVSRSVTFTTYTSLAISSCDYQTVANGGSVSTTTNNSACIPFAIYGFKKSLDITAIVSNVSTDARKCILSDNVTNVDDAINEAKVAYSSTERKIGKWFGQDLYEKTIDCGAFPNTTSKNVAHGIANLDKVIDVRGIGIASSGSYPLPFVQVSGTTTQGIRLNTNATNVQLISSYDASSVTNSYVTIRYTKSS